MPTQEERLAAVERAVMDINHNETILLGMAVKYEELLREIRAMLAQMVGHLGEHDRRFDAHDKRFDAHDKRFDAHDKRFDAHDKRFDEHDKRFDRLEALLMQVLARLPEPS
ncbi:hypothetical protein [Thermogemmatispora tikiterensis]|uniref:Uncharacterized protein n=1 Tax=Thermogemmatispora tikiterensis TaxID=1825093 RepID=A0A328VE20_9CHLR|nr:hypothetical protein [Thermogemmatispora tikiterensis]RAQ94000.1 hypothetical protein A4R35_00550 [Thermogemmatispora tikiterensis]